MKYVLAVAVLISLTGCDPKEMEHPTVADIERLAPKPLTQCRIDEQQSSVFGGGIKADAALTKYCNQMLADGWKPISAGVQFVWVK